MTTKTSALSSHFLQRTSNALTLVSFLAALFISWKTTFWTLLGMTAIQFFAAATAATLISNRHIKAENAKKPNKTELDGMLLSCENFYTGACSLGMSSCVWLGLWVAYKGDVSMSTCFLVFLLQGIGMSYFATLSKEMTTLYHLGGYITLYQFVRFSVISSALMTVGGVPFLKYVYTF